MESLTVWGLGSVLCDDPEGWDGSGRGAEEKLKREGIICIHIADSLCFIAETNITLSTNYTPIKKER